MGSPMQHLRTAPHTSLGSPRLFILAIVALLLSIMADSAEFIREGRDRAQGVLHYSGFLRNLDSTKVGCTSMDRWAPATRPLVRPNSLSRAGWQQYLNASQHIAGREILIRWLDREVIRVEEEEVEYRGLVKEYSITISLRAE